MAATLATHGLGTVTSEESTKDAQLFQIPIPASNSSSLIALDLFGASRTINISGTWTSSDSSGSDNTIALFIAWLDGLVNGAQPTRNYVSATSGSTYKVFVQSVKWSVEGGDVSHIKYDISMLEAAQYGSLE
jgi:hypothetical protein